MYTIKDYLVYYKDIPFEDAGFNVMDNVLFSALVYLPIEDMTMEAITIHDLAVLYKSLATKLERDLNYVGKKVAPLLQEIMNSVRYKNVMLDNIRAILDNRLQFFAVTFRYNNMVYVAYRGTDNSISGWKENFNLSYSYPTDTQVLAADYLSDTITDLDKKIYVGGHSKGGNLAMASVMKIRDAVYDRIVLVYNNDGPGFLKNEFDSDEYKRLHKRLYNIIPEESAVGVLLFNKNYNVICSTGSGLMQHDLTSWCCFGPFLVKGKLSRFSKKLQTRTNKWLAEMDDASKAQVIDTFFKVIEESGAIHFRDLSWTEIMNLVRRSVNVDEKSKQLLMDTLKVYMK